MSDALVHRNSKLYCIILRIMRGQSWSMHRTCFVASIGARSLLIRADTAHSTLASKVRIGESMRGRWGCLGKKWAFNAYAMGVSEAKVGQSMRARWATFARESPDDRAMSIASSLCFKYRI